MRMREAHLPAPGLHRLNRTEYTNAIRDLLALNIDAATFLPADDSSHGFDNMAGTLTTSPALMEAYLSAAGKISRLGRRHRDRADAGRVRRAARHVAERLHRRAAVRHARRHADRARVPGRRQLRLHGQGNDGLLHGRARQRQAASSSRSRSTAHACTCSTGTRRSAPNEGNGGRTPEIPIKAGFHRVGVTFIATSDLPDTGLNRSFVRTMNSPGSISGYTFYPHVGQVFIEGPFNGARGDEHAEPRQDLRVLPRGEQRGSRVRAHDHLHAGGQSLPPPRRPRPTSRR